MSNTTANTRYISFCGELVTPDTNETATLEKDFPLIDGGQGGRTGMQYDHIDGQDQLSIYLAKVPFLQNIGHLVADCPAGGWYEETFCILDAEGNPVKSADNLNPNPVPQLLEF